MIDDDLPPELNDLFNAERARDAPPPEAKARVRGALALSIGGAFGGEGGGDPGGGDLGGGMDPSAAVDAAANLATAGAAGTTAAAATTAAATTAATVATGSTVGKGLAIALVAAMAGTAGTGVYLAQEKSEEREREKIVVVDEAPRHDPKIDPSILLPKDPPAPPVIEKPKQIEKKIARAPMIEEREVPIEPTPEIRAERLRAERAILDEARGAVSRGDGGAALIALEAHRAQFPEGRLVEEREALTILSLAKLDRADEARKKANRFRARWPQSMFAPAINASIGQ